MSNLLAKLRSKVTFRSSDTPILVAGLFVLLGMVCWIHNKDASARALTITRINIVTLQSCLRQYEAAGLPAPAVVPGKPAIYGFLVAFQRAFAHQKSPGKWRCGCDPLSYLQKSTLVKGWIPMPHGGRLWGIVMVKDGFGHPVRYLHNTKLNWRSPCFAATLPAVAGRVVTLYSVR